MAKKDCENNRHKHMCQLKDVFNFMNNNTQRRKELLRSTGFGAFLRVCQWNRISGEFVKWVSTNFEPEECQLRLNEYLVLPISAEDIQRVYDLPNKGATVDESECKESSITKLRRELRLNLKVKENDWCTIGELKNAIKTAKKDEIWCKAVIVYLLGCFLCPDKQPTVSLKYAHILEDLNTVSDYNWCKHILKHLRRHTKGYRVPKADMHFFLVSCFNITSSWLVVLILILHVLILLCVY